MPIYTYEHPKTKKLIDIQQSMSEEHVFIDENGLKWNRVFYPTHFAFDTKLDPHDPRAFVKKTEKGGTLGDIMDLSKEMSERRGGDKSDEIKMNYSKEKQRKLNQKRLENLKEERKKQLEEFKKIDKTKVKIKKNSSSTTRRTP